MINIDTHFFLEARHVDFMTTIKERSWFANATNHDAFRAVSNLLTLNTAVKRGARAQFLQNFRLTKS